MKSFASEKVICCMGAERGTWGVAGADLHFKVLYCLAVHRHKEEGHVATYAEPVTEHCQGCADDGPRTIEANQSCLVLHFAKSAMQNQPVNHCEDCT
jgi:hypothetical protein